LFFLTNPERKMARRLPKRDSKGRFVRGGGSSRRRSTKRRRRNPARSSSRTAAPRRARSIPRNADGTFASSGGGSRRRSSYRRNPPAGRMFRRVTDAAVGAVQLTVGKAASRAIPGLVNLPEQGPVGVATRAGAAVVVGLVADQFLSSSLAERLLEGGLQGCVEDLVVGYNIPFIGPALARAPGMVVAGGTTGRYTYVGPPDSLRAGRGIARKQLRAYIPESSGWGLGSYTGGGDWLRTDRMDPVYHRA